MGDAEIQESGLLKRRRAAVVLEVLGGAKSPPEAAEALGIALPSYYLLEARALEGLVEACAPRTRGRGGGDLPGSSSLRRENERLRQELARSQALHRAVQRAAGVPVRETEKTGRKARRPRARALRAAKLLSPDVGKTSLPTSPLDVKPSVS